MNGQAETVTERGQGRHFRVVGVDVSLASTGIAALTHTPTGRWTSLTTTVETKKRVNGSADLLARMNHTTATVVDHVRNYADLVVIESGAFATRTSMAHALAGCWWSVYRALDKLDVDILEVPPARVKKYATGKGNADKAAVGVAAGRMWPEVDIASTDAADALVLASLGAHWSGLDLPYDITGYRAETVAALTQPERHVA